MRTGARTTAGVLAAVAAALSVCLSATAEAAPPTADSGARGLDLTARWWTAALEGGDLGFFEDATDGSNCVTVDLPSGPVVLVAGTLGGASGPRSCAVPEGATIVLPVINTFFATTEAAPVETIGLARRETRDFLEGATASATVDGQAVEVRRIRSSRFLLDASALGVPELLPAVSDGYWLVFEAEAGVHTVTTTGASSGFESATTYTFTVT